MKPDELKAIRERAEKARGWWADLHPGDDRHAVLADLHAVLGENERLREALEYVLGHAAFEGDWSREALAAGLRIINGAARRALSPERMPSDG